MFKGSKIKASDLWREMYKRGIKFKKVRTSKTIPSTDKEEQNQKFIESQKKFNELMQQGKTPVYTDQMYASVFNFKK